MVEEKDDATFEDPLANYDAPTYRNLESALVEQPVAEIQSSPVALISPDTKVSIAVKHMHDNEVACLIVAEEGKLLGVFSIRDVLNRVAEEYDAKKDLPVREVMTSSPIFAYDTDASGAALAVMAASGYRHVPVLDSQDSVIGIVSPKRVMDFLLAHLRND